MGTLVVSALYVSRHAPTLNAQVGSSVQVLLPEDVILNSSSALQCDLLAPGTPATHRVVLNGGSCTESRRASGGRGGSAGDAAADSAYGNRGHRSQPAVAGAHRLCVAAQPDAESGAGEVTVPGVCGTFIANSGTRLRLGVAGAAEPSVYDLQGLVLNGGSQLLIAGPVVLNVAGAVAINGNVGDPGHVAWLRLNVAAGGVTVNSQGQLADLVRAPAGQVTIANAPTFGAIDPLQMLR